MAYQVLARKWRPRTLDSLIGQEHVVRALTHALTEGRLHHAYLFTGTRGVGKTTLARILAKSFNCETGVTATPCGQCSTCAEIDSGRFVDLLEVDAATNTKVDEMRQLLENAVYVPTRGRFKVYVIDEVHMLSNSAFNAMLKTLEEPPEHVKFILATTDPQKIPVTVLSRCMQFNLKQMTPSLIVKHLRHILDAEQIPADLAALNLLAHSASGSMRDALSLLDQAIAHGGGKVIETQVCDMLGLVDLDYLFLILEALLDNNIAKMLDIVDDMAVRSLSFDSALQELASLLTRIQVAQLAPEAVADDLPEKTRLLLLAEKFDAEFIQLAYQIAIHSRKELSLAPDEQAGFIMTLLRLHTFLPVLPHTVSARDQVCAPLAAANSSVQTAPVMEVSRPIDIMPDHSSVSCTPIAATTPPRGDETKLFLNLPDWSNILDTLALTGIVRELGQQCELLEIGEKEVKLRLDPTYRHLQIKSSQDKLKQVLSEHFGRPLALSITVEEVLKEVPATRAQRNKQERQEKILALIEQDEFIQEAISLFNATVIPSSIKPV